MVNREFFFQNCLIFEVGHRANADFHVTLRENTSNAAPAASTVRG